MSSKKTSGIPPNETLYLNNLNDKISKATLRRNLYHLFVRYGDVIDVVALKTVEIPGVRKEMRGQAWVVFDEIASATAAMRGLQGFNFFDKPIRIQYAKTKSKAVLARGDKFVSRKKRKRDEAAAKRKLEAAAFAGTMTDAPALTNGSATSSSSSSSSSDGAADTIDTSLAVPRPLKDVPENKTLICEDLPKEASEEMLTMLFEQFKGLQEIRLIAGKSLAFIEYDNVGNAANALSSLSNFKLSPTNLLFVNYANQ